MGSKFVTIAVSLLLALSVFVAPVIAAPSGCPNSFLSLISRSVDPSRVNVERDAIAHGGWNSRKEFRRMLRDAQYSDHGKKHLQARTPEQAKALSDRAAQYLPSKSNRTLETEALRSTDGFVVERPNGAFWKVYRFKDPVGYDSGELTRWIRVEYSSGVYHGHPMSLERVKKYVTGAEP